jgi:hypothetical protein
MPALPTPCDPAHGELRVTGRVSSWALNRWLESLLSIAMAADVYRVESGSLVFERLDSSNGGRPGIRTLTPPV